MQVRVQRSLLKKPRGREEPNIFRVDWFERAQRFENTSIIAGQSLYGRGRQSGIERHQGLVIQA